MTLATPFLRLRALAASALLLLCATASLAQTPVPGFLNGDCEILSGKPGHAWIIYNGYGGCINMADASFGEYPSRDYVAPYDSVGGMAGNWEPATSPHPTRTDRRLITQTVVLADGALEGKVVRFSVWANHGPQNGECPRDLKDCPFGDLELTFLTAGGVQIGDKAVAPIDLTGPKGDYRRSEVSATVPVGTRQVVTTVADDTIFNYDNSKNYDDFALTYEDALPVELVSFTAAADGASAAVLRWETASETNNAGFAVETLRSATWQEVAFVTGRGTTSEAHTYTRTVSGLAPGRHAFRLRQVDLDGTATLSAAVEVVIDGDGRLRVYPSPARSSVRIEGLTAAADVVDALGRVVARAMPGEALAVDAWAPGVYVVMASTPQRFVVAR